MKNIVLWFLALFITLFASLYQRITGPTHPYRAKAELDDIKISYKLAKTHESSKDYKIRIDAPNPDIEGYVIYKRHNTDELWSKLHMSRKENMLVAALPRQPCAGKLDYKVFLIHRGKEISLSGKNPVIIRFKGRVPLTILIPHIIIIFTALLFSTRAGLEALKNDADTRKLTILSTIFLFIGGIVLGSIVQKFAFGSIWTGIPFGTDLTDNKTLIALTAWIAALIARRRRHGRFWVLGASIITLLAFSIPHSLLGSELDYSKIKILAFPQKA